jgi:hypothetical protein
MPNPLKISLVAFVSAAIALSACAFPPEPAPVPQSWEFDVEFGDLHAITVDVKKIGPQGEEELQPMSFFYLTYTVTNHSGQDLLFAPNFELGTDKGPPIPSGRAGGVPREATAQILELQQNPFLETQLGILGTLQQGEENAKEGLVVWVLDDLTVDEVTVYAAGFSGETDTLEWTDPQSGESVRVILQKTREMRFATPGTIDPSASEPFRLKERPRWIMR